jgi:F-type H+-transporting ATPase subunit epsilon
MQPALMNLEVLLPFRIFAKKTGVSRIVAETHAGSFGLLPRRLDCVAALAPGILIYENEAEGEVYVAVDEGVLVKTGLDVLVSVRNAIGGTDLGQLREAVEREFLNLNEREQSVRSVMAKMEIGAQAARKLKARRNSTQGVWFGLGMMGLIGWSVVVPTLLGAALGIWLDNSHPGSYSWTLMLLVIGLVIGCLNAWHWVAKEDQAMREEQEDNHE